MPYNIYIKYNINLTVLPTATNLFFVLLHFEAVAAKKAKGQKRFQIKVKKEISAVNTRCLLSDRSINPFLKKKK